MTAKPGSIHWVLPGISSRKEFLGMDVADELRKMGYKVQKFTEWHFRVSWMEFWLPRGKWHDMRTGDRGQKPLDQIPFFIHRRLNPDSE